MNLAVCNKILQQQWLKQDWGSSFSVRQGILGSSELMQWLQEVSRDPGSFGLVSLTLKLLFHPSKWASALATMFLFQAGRKGRTETQKAKTGQVCVTHHRSELCPMATPISREAWKYKKTNNKKTKNTQAFSFICILLYERNINKSINC